MAQTGDSPSVLVEWILCLGGWTIPRPVTVKHTRGLVGTVVSSLTFMEG